MIAPPPIQLASLGMADSLILMVLALVVFGPRRLPQIGRQIGKLMFEFRKASNDFKFQMEEELRLAEDADRRKREEAERQRIAALAEQTSAPTLAPSVEAQADIGAIEPPSVIDASGTIAQADIDASSPDTVASGSSPDAVAPGSNLDIVATGSSPDAVLWPQPPQTGEQVSASRPLPESEEAAEAELNPDATVAANSVAVSANPAAAADLGSSGCESAAISNPPSPDSGTGNSTKEPVNQHG